MVYDDKNHPSVNSAWDKRVLCISRILAPHGYYYLTLLYALVKSVFLFDLEIYKIAFI